MDVQFERVLDMRRFVLVGLFYMIYSYFLLDIFSAMVFEVFKNIDAHFIY